MPRISFKEDKKEKTPEVVTTPESSTALVPREERALVPYTNNSEFQGEIDPDEALRPRISIVAKTGKMADLFTPGDILLNSEFVIGGVKTPIELIPVVAKKRYQNDLPQNDEDEYGDTVDTMLEVLDRGGVKGYRPFDDKTSTHFWKPILQAVFLVKRPNGLAPEAALLFPFALGEDGYTFASYVARNKSAYGNVAKPGVGLALLDAVKRAAVSNGSIRDYTYRLSTKGVSWQPPKGDPKSWIEISLRAAGKTSDELKELIKTIEG